MVHDRAVIAVAPPALGRGRNGVIALALGIMIWRHWPSSGLWVIGLFIGIDMVFYGWSSVMIGMAARRLSRVATTPF